jgi:predicted hotdog family 3-hydroxylacyl-ACP dehydratase
MAGDGRLPLWVWLLPLATAIAAVAAWGGWCETETGTWLGGVLIAASGLLVFSLALESVQHRSGLTAALRRTAVAVGLGLAATAVTFLAAGIGYELHCTVLF